MIGELPPGFCCWRSARGYYGHALECANRVWLRQLPPFSFWTDYDREARAHGVPDAADVGAVGVDPYFTGLRQRAATRALKDQWAALPVPSMPALPTQDPARMTRPLLDWGTMTAQDLVELSEYSAAFAGNLAFAPTVIRSDVGGKVWLMNRREGGFSQRAYSYEDLWALARAWRLRFEAFGADEWGRYIAVSPCADFTRIETKPAKASEKDRVIELRTDVANDLAVLRSQVRELQAERDRLRGVNIGMLATRDQLGRSIDALVQRLNRLERWHGWTADGKGLTGGV